MPYQNKFLEQELLKIVSFVTSNVFQRTCPWGSPVHSHTWGKGKRLKRFSIQLTLCNEVVIDGNILSLLATDQPEMSAKGNQLCKYPGCNHVVWKGYEFCGRTHGRVYAQLPKNEDRTLG